MGRVDENVRENKIRLKDDSINGCLMIWCGLERRQLGGLYDSMVGEGVS